MTSWSILAMRPPQKRYLKDTIRSGLPGRAKSPTQIMNAPFSGNLTTPYTPPFKVVRQYFIVATIAFILLNGLMLFSYQYIQGYHFQPRLLAFVHIGVLGWATLIIMGAMTQLVPVILETSLCSVRLSQWGLWLYLAGVAGITAHFWLLAGGDGGMASVAIIAFLAIILFAANIGLTLRKVKAINITVVHIIAAILYLASVATLGLLLARLEKQKTSLTPMQMTRQPYQSVQSWGLSRTRQPWPSAIGQPIQGRHQTTKIMPSSSGPPISLHKMSSFSLTTPATAAANMIQPRQTGTNSPR